MVDQSRRVRDWLQKFDAAAHATLVVSLERMQAAAAEQRRQMVRTRVAGVTYAPAPAGAEQWPAAESAV